jgi:RNA recognition motif-containing protein
MDTTRNPSTAFLRNVSYSATQRDIEGFFSPLLTSIVGIRIPIDNETGSPRGMAYVEFQTPQVLEQALAMTGGDLCGRPVHIDVARNRDRKQSGTQQQQSSFSNNSNSGFGRSYGGGGGGGQQQQQQVWSDNGGNRQGADPFTAFVSGLPQDTTEHDVEEIFAGLSISKLRVPRDRETNEVRGMAFVEFTTQEDLDEAVTRNGVMLREAPVSIAVSEKRNKGPRASYGNRGNSSGFEAQGGQFSRSQDPDAFAAFGNSKGRKGAAGGAGTGVPGNEGGGRPSRQQFDAPPPSSTESATGETAGAEQQQRPRLELKKRSVDAPLNTKAATTKAVCFYLFVSPHTNLMDFKNIEPFWKCKAN